MKVLKVMGVGLIFAFTSNVFAGDKCKSVVVRVVNKTKAVQKIKKIWSKVGSSEKTYNGKNKTVDVNGSVEYSDTVDGAKCGGKAQFKIKIKDIYKNKDKTEWSNSVVVNAGSSNAITCTINDNLSLSCN